METYLIGIAALLSAAWFALHLFVGTRQIATPLLTAPDLDPTVAATNWMCWHMVTAILGLNAVFFAGSLWVPTLLLPATLIAAALAAAGIIAGPATGTSYARLPQGWLFVPIALLGVTAL